MAITAGPAVLIVVAALAISLPARRAMQQNPIVALRAELRRGWNGRSLMCSDAQ